VCFSLRFYVVGARKKNARNVYNLTNNSEWLVCAIVDNTVPN